MVVFYPLSRQVPKFHMCFSEGEIVDTVRFVGGKKAVRSLYESKPAVKVLLVPLIGSSGKALFG